MEVVALSPVPITCWALINYKLHLKRGNTAIKVSTFVSPFSFTILVYKAFLCQSGFPSGNSRSPHCSKYRLQPLASTTNPDIITPCHNPLRSSSILLVVEVCIGWRPPPHPSFPLLAEHWCSYHDQPAVARITDYIGLGTLLGIRGRQSAGSVSSSSMHWLLPAHQGHGQLTWQHKIQ